MSIAKTPNCSDSYVPKPNRVEAAERTDASAQSVTAACSGRPPRKKV